MTPVPASTQARVILTWELRLFLFLGLPATVSGALVTAVIIAVCVLYNLLFGIPLLDPDGTLGLHDSLRSTALLAVVLGYMFGALGYGSVRIETDVEALGFALEEGTGLPRAQVQRARVVGALGFVLGLGFLAWVQMMIGNPLSLAFLREMGPLVVSSMLVFSIGARIVFLSVQRNPFVSAVEEAEIDLLDLRYPRALGRMALRNTLLFVLGMALFIPWILIPGFAPAFGPLLVASLVLPPLVLVIPVRRIRSRIRATKREQLALLDLELQGVRDDVLAGDKAVAGRLADLLAYRAFIQGVREWPFDAQMLTRFTLYLLIPLGSWVGSAMVERFVNATLE